MLTNANFLAFITLNRSPLHQILACGTYVLPQLRQFWTHFKGSYWAKALTEANISDLRLRLQELQEEDKQAWKIRVEQLGQLEKEDWKNINRVLHHQGLPYVPEIIQTELISRHYNNLLAGQFGIEKTQELVARKYYWETLRHDVKDHIKECDVCLASKAVQHKPYGDLQSLPVPIHWWKDLSMDYVTGLLISAN